MSRSQLATALKISKHTVRDIERQKMKISDRIRTRFIDLCIDRELEKKFYKWLGTNHIKKVAGADPEFSKDARRILKLSQRDFASALGVSSGLVKLIETSRCRLTDNFLIRVDALMKFHFPDNPQFSKTRSMKIS